MDEPTNTFDIIKESELEDRVIETITIETQKEKKAKIHEKSQWNVESQYAYNLDPKCRRKRN